MPTPKSGAISMNDMRTEINRATGSSISMSEMRTRFGGSGAISFSDLRGCEGFTVNCSFNTDKFGDNDGFRALVFGSVSPNDGNGRLQFAANSWLYEMYSASFNPTVTFLTIMQNDSTLSSNGTQVTAGFKVTDVNRLVAANTSVNISGTFSNNESSYLTAEYDMPNSGTIHCLVRFA